MRSHKVLRFQFQVGPDTWIFITDKNCVENVINNKKDPVPRHSIMKVFAKPVKLSRKASISIFLQIICNQNSKDSLLVTNNTAYAKQIRKAYLTGFQTSQLKLCFPKMKMVMDNMIKIIEARRRQGLIDFQKLCVELSLDSIGVAALEMSLGGLDGSRGICQGIVETARIGREEMTMPLLSAYCKLFPNSEIAKERAEISAKLRKEWNQLTKEILDRPDPSKGETPVWYNFKTVIDPDTNAPLPFDMLRSEIATVVFAGMDTTGHQLCWILGMLATHPTVSETLVNELKEHGLFGRNGTDVTYEDLGKLPYLNAVIKEGFRLAYVISFGVPRQLPKDMTVLGYRLPKGIILNFPGNRAMNTKANWEDPNAFKPERWLTEEDLSSKYFDMFQTGPRSCPGRNLTLLEIRLAIVKLISKYHFMSNKSSQELLENSFDGAVIECKGGMWFQILPRDVE